MRTYDKLCEGCEDDGRNLYQEHLLAQIPQEVNPQLSVDIVESEGFRQFLWTNYWYKPEEGLVRVFPDRLVRMKLYEEKYYNVTVRTYKEEVTVAELDATYPHSPDKGIFPLVSEKSQFKHPPEYWGLKLQKFVGKLRQKGWLSSEFHTNDDGTQQTECPFHDHRSNRAKPLNLNFSYGIWYCSACVEGGGYNKFRKLLQ